VAASHTHTHSLQRTLTNHPTGVITSMPPPPLLHVPECDLWPLPTRAMLGRACRQGHVSLTLSGTNPLSLHHPVVGGANQWEGPQCWEEPYLKSTLDMQTDLNYILNCYFEPGVLDQPLSIEVRLQSTHGLKIIMHTKCITAVRRMNVSFWFRFSISILIN